MEETGKVVGIRSGRAEVDLVARDECEHCSAHAMCNWTGNRLRRVLAVNRAGASPGDRVVLSTVEGSGLRSNLLIFGIPVVGMVAGVLLGGLLLSDLWAGILSGAGLVLGILIVKLIDISASRSGKSLPVVVRRLDKDQSKGEDGDKTADSAAGCGHGDDGR